MSVIERRPVVAGNWKMHKTSAEGFELARSIVEALVDLHGVELLLAPPFTALAAVAKAVDGTSIGLAGQNCHFESQGAFTGEISAPMLKELGCRYVIVGHSERRQYFGETNALVNQKARAVIASGMRPILCLGESLAQREAGQTLQWVAQQLEEGLRGFTVEQVRTSIIAYEPIWAIGTGKVATAGQAQEVHAHLREQLTRLFGREAASHTRIQYGGSVKPENAAELLGQPDIDGALVGGASLKVSDFTAIARAAAL